MCCECSSVGRRKGYLAEGTGNRTLVDDGGPLSSALVFRVGEWPSIWRVGQAMGVGEPPISPTSRS